VGSILAFGFAPFTGGALSYIDGIGANRFVKIAKGLQKKYGAEFKVPKLLLDMAEKGETFYQRFDPYQKGEVREAA
ncbi:3-hydroxyacyl-CoA dehydrogenase, partial [Mesorhizobium sp. M2A.F.Ca.ET.037.01.1.1]